MPRLVAKQAFAYGMRELVASDEFEASEKDARVLKMIGKADDAPAAAPVYETRAETAADDDAQPKPKGKGRYARRDMQAEEA